ncbi:DegT/DnrJ/EryC1/StrS family aminotransferase [Campylobacter canadensis]|uniref:DegT/DnrJ/EryC1/StrS family aminotransferase n=1 Tax=Campylobacter canadensis TaxID=449520 RepID=UPI0015579F5F|nr:DegT/DnrJ/EryC1/StrS family aminotransferase [Campylobacter canadensis]MBZ7993930.1 DegT/DnrJ/EryC1/StrS family aminotransferase [Campylobacter canadensis]MBZ7996246.1 DegT/DnrJ/EryC1/StrS family aminotransferase [Campylobacter canadensis]MBZ7999263.1 DegT/DnrJ/EryC1/StrS family aminotransferase [Campylobacter canadensis]MBZ8001059.1 DegT/DnrJ/EryC1/StrS family aminotransferase [Campylobacter canadensis]MBZ8003588.1 DegT/DnrJ/EryC1/StrS family aminotransferase [Campylobacter canadensis]
MFSFINLQAQYKAYKEEIDLEISKILNQAQFIAAPCVKELESNLSKYIKIKHSISCSNGTSALLAALNAIDIKEDDEIITSAFTFIASAEMIALCKAKVVFVDINMQDLNLDINEVKKAITPKTKAILAVSIFGQMPNLLELKKIAEENNIYLIEDAAQSFGAKDNKNNISGSIAHISTTSFFPSKPLGCYGDGGAVFTNDDFLAEKIRLFVNHGSKQRYLHEIIGVNARLDSIQAAVLNVKLKHFDEELAKRQELAKIYDDNLINCKKIKIKDSYTSVYAQYSILVDDREKIINEFIKNDLPYAVHYPMPLHKQPCFKEYNKLTLKNTEYVCKHIISLPFCAFLDKNNQEKVISMFKNL